MGRSEFYPPGEALAHLHSKGAFPAFAAWEMVWPNHETSTSYEGLSGCFGVGRREEKDMRSPGPKIQLGELCFIWNDCGSTRINWGFFYCKGCDGCIIDTSIHWETANKNPAEMMGLSCPYDKRRLVRSFWGESEIAWHWIACVKVVCVSTVGTEEDTTVCDQKQAADMNFTRSRGSKRNKLALEWRSNPALVVIIVKWTWGVSIQ